MACSPVRTRSESPSGTGRSRSALGSPVSSAWMWVPLDDRQIVIRVTTEQGGRRGGAVLEGYGELIGALDDVLLVTIRPLRWPSWRR